MINVNSIINAISIINLKFFVYFCLILIFSSCNNNEKDSSSLPAISKFLASNPQRALESLDSIDYCALSASDRHFYDFLTIKAKDKSYIEHTDDSLILDVIKYYSTTDIKDVYAEALYYGGRVYSDLGIIRLLHDFFWML